MLGIGHGKQPAQGDLSHGEDSDRPARVRLETSAAPGPRIVQPGEKLGFPTLTPEQRDLVARHTGLVGVHLRTRVPTPREPTRTREYDDLFQEGCVALARAAARYDRDRDGPFAAFALPRIRGAIHNALREQFSIVRVPARAATRARNEPTAATPGNQPSFVELTHELGLPARRFEPTGAEFEAIGHVVRQRFERAVRDALAELEQRQWRRRNPCPIMARIADERLLISRESQRTPLRRIAREAGVSSSRASAYERLLHETIQEHCRRDPQLPVLLGFGREDEAGFDGPIDPARRRRLAQADVDDFGIRFRRLGRSDRAELLYRLIERTTPAVTEVARNLYRITLPEETGTLSEVA